MNGFHYARATREPFGGAFRRIITVLLLILFIACASPARAAGDGAGVGLGVAWAPISGHGFSLRAIPNEGIGFQGGLIFWKNSSSSYFNIGASALMVLKHTSSSALYIPIGISLNRFSETSQNDWNGRTTTTTDGSTAIGAGLGFTMKTPDWENIWYSVDLVLVVRKDTIFPLPQIGVHYFI